MTFGMDGPMIIGWWVNPQTGDKFNAIDSFFEDNNLLIKTADGRLLRYDQIQNYVKTDKPSDIPTPKQTHKEDIPAEVLAELEGSDDLLIPDDDIYGAKLPQAEELGNIYKNTPSQTADYDIIHRALNGKKDQLQFRGNIEWSNFPQREIEMLIDVMNISEEEIIQYFINTISVNDVINTIKENIRVYISDKLHLPELPKEDSDKDSKNPTPQNKPHIEKKTKKKVNG